jgi:hypothetical protein
MNNQADFIADCLAFTGIGTFASLTLITEPKLNVKDRVTKEPRPFQRLHKIQDFINALLGADYEVRVNKQREREGVEQSFESAKASGRTRINALLSHKDDNAEQMYLSVYIDKATIKNTKYVDENGRTYTWAEVQNFLPVPKQGNAKQELVDEIKIICPKLESIHSIHTFGKVY